MTDNEGGKSFANMGVTVGSSSSPGTVVIPAARGPLVNFKLSGPSFGGVKKRSLVVRYRLRERSTVIVSLYRGNSASAGSPPARSGRAGPSASS